MNRHKKLLVPIIAGLILSVAGPTLAQRPGRSGYSNNQRDSSEVLNAFRSVVADARQCTVRVLCDGKETALGTVVGADGWIVTKYSELREPVACRLVDGRKLAAQIIGQDSRYDLAMLKVDASGLKAVEWSDDDKGPAVGQLLATASASSELPREIGVVSVPRRQIPRQFGILGVQFNVTSDESRAKILIVEKGSGAERGGIKVGDVVTRVADKPIDSREMLIDTIHQYEPGDTVTLVVRRGEEDVNITATLTSPTQGARAAGDRSARMNQMGTQVSKRSADFPSVIQHDTALLPPDCGGPLVDLSGKVVGINIARGGRTETYAAPADKVRSLLADLEGGKLAPKNPLPGAVIVKIDEKTDKTVAQTNQAEIGKTGERANKADEVKPDDKQPPGK